MNQVLPGLFLGDIEAAQNREALDYIKCTHVLVATNSIDPCFPDVINPKTNPLYIGVQVQSV